eukprot:4851756-Amphidinium_carterae.2
MAGADSQHGRSRKASFYPIAAESVWTISSFHHWESQGVKDNTSAATEFIRDQATTDAYYKDNCPFKMNMKNIPTQCSGERDVSGAHGHCLSNGCYLAASTHIVCHNLYLEVNGLARSEHIGKNLSSGGELRFA